MSRHWYSLTDEEMLRLNPPDDVFDDEAFYDAWQAVGVVPRPRTRLGWFCYHLLHGLLMRYPPHKVLGFALANTKPETVDVDLNDEVFLAPGEYEPISIFGALIQPDRVEQTATGRVYYWDNLDFEIANNCTEGDNFLVVEMSK